MKRKIELLFSVLFLLIFLVACEKENPRELCGVWVIDKMTVESKPFEKFLQVNTISFKCEDNSVFISGSMFYERDSRAKWKITKIKNQNNLKIESSIKIFNDNFKVSINKKSNGQLHLSLKSKKVEISALKIIEDR
jgi:hypothetical protein